MIFLELGFNSAKFDLCLFQLEQVYCGFELCNFDFIGIRVYFCKILICVCSNWSNYIVVLNVCNFDYIGLGFISGKFWFVFVPIGARILWFWNYATSIIFELRFKYANFDLWLFQLEQVYSGFESDIQGADWKVQTATPA